MMRTRMLLSAMIPCLMTAAMLRSAPATGSGNLTVGEFVALIASRTSSDGVVRPVAAADAAEILKRSGIKIKTNLASLLTEGDAADLFHQFGITLQVEHTDSVLSRDRAEALVAVFGSTLNAASIARGSLISLLSKVGSPISGRTSSVGLETASSVLDCQQLPRPDPCDQKIQDCNPCMTCCIHELGLTGKVCGHACQKRNLVVTPSDPTP